MPQGKQGQTYEELGGETSEKIHLLGKEVSTTEILKPKSFSWSTEKPLSVFQRKISKIQLFNCSCASEPATSVAESVPIKFFTERHVEMMSLIEIQKEGFTTA